MNNYSLTPQRLLTAPEVAARLNVSSRWVYRRASAGDLPFVHLGNGPRSPLRVDPVDLSAWLENLKKSTSIEQPTEQQLCR
jgi:excisionase family DNA binding protein